MQIICRFFTTPRAIKMHYKGGSRRMRLDFYPRGCIRPVLSMGPFRPIYVSNVKEGALHPGAVTVHYFHITFLFVSSPMAYI